MLARLAPLALLALVNAAAAAEPAAEVVSVEGKGEYREAEQTAWRPAAIRQPLYVTNYVRTLDASKMAILLVNHTQLRLAANSVIQIKEVPTSPGKKTILELNRGRSWTQSKTVPDGLIMQTPSALAAIRGTDWEMSVDDNGVATLTVFSGEVEFYNDQGRVTVQPNEQARAEKGKAPVKLLLQVSRDRMQWVSSFTVDPARYEGDPRAAALLLESDAQVYAGDLDAAARILAAAAPSFPNDERFEAGRARIALLRGDVASARAHARAALAIRPGSAEALVVLGDIERYDGMGAAAFDAYARASLAAPTDARAWYGMGAVDAERENVERARTNLAKAIGIDADNAQYRAELGMLEGVSGDLAHGFADVEAAVKLHPDNYVALTGLGVLHLHAGHVDEAMDALLRASLIEPRYSRAHLYLAAAYYAARRDDAALAELRRAAETDPNDPMPHLLAGIIHMDRIEPGLAAQDAQRALKLMPYLKSVNQAADNQKGVVNAGTPPAYMGLEAWARSAAQESYLPFWGASHLFLADRYPGDFDKRSELMQGFVTDPMSFGASNRFQALIAQPGNFGTASLRYSTSDDARLVEPVITLNGSVAAPVPLSYFVEGVDTRVDPGNTQIDERAKTLTAAVGARPTAELATFIYGTYLDADAKLGAPDATGDFAHVKGTSSRVDAGLRYTFDASSSLWVKGGAGAQDSTDDEKLSVVVPGTSLVQLSNFATKPTTNDISARYTIARESLELTAGAETARMKTPKTLVRDPFLRPVDTPVPQESLDESDHDRSGSVYGIGRWTAGPVRFDLGLAWSDYRKDRDISTHQSFGDNHFQETYRRSRADPLAGLVWRIDPRSLVRAACRRWARPASLDTLAPVAVAGVPLDDQLVFAGGVLEQCRGQFEWSDASRTFVTAYAERSRVHNLVSPLDGVQNTNTDVTNLDRLRNRAVAPVPKPDQLEDTPVYGEGAATRGTVAIDRIVATSVALRAYYTYTDSENTAPAFEGRVIPYLPRHQVNLGATWSPGWHAFVTAQAVYRSRRFTDEANLVPLPASWDAYLDVFVESPDKRWSVEAYGINLLKKEASDVFGIVVSYRF